MIAFALFVLHTGAFFLIKDHGMMMDEHYHYAQIQRFLHGDFRVNADLPMVPGYHGVIAGLSWVLGIGAVPYYPAVAMIRGVSWALSVASLVFFFLSARLLDRATAERKTLLYGMFPLFFPFFSLLYTDMVSLTIVLIATWFFLKKWYGWCGLMMTLSILVRQNNIIWCAFFPLALYVHDQGYAYHLKGIYQAVKKSMSFLLAPLVFFVALWWMGGVASGETSQQYVKATIVVPKNLFLLLFLYVPFFLPLFVVQYRAMAQVIQRVGWYWLGAPVAFLLFHSTFFIEHPYNYGSFFIHNAILEYFTADWRHSLIFFSLMVLAVLSLSVTRLYERSMYLIYPFTVIFFLPLWFIEQRYTMIPFALFLLFRTSYTRPVEWVLIGWNIVLSGIIYWGMFSWKFFW